MEAVAERPVLRMEITVLICHGYDIYDCHISLLLDNAMAVTLST